MGFNLAFKGFSRRSWLLGFVARHSKNKKRDKQNVSYIGSASETMSTFFYCWNPTRWISHKYTTDKTQQPNSPKNTTNKVQRRNSPKNGIKKVQQLNGPKYA